MIDIGDEPAGAPGKRRIGMPVFQNFVSSGQVLILLGLLGTGIATIFAVGGTMRGLQDGIDEVNVAIKHEAELRTNGEMEFQRQMAVMQRQETSDVANTDKAITTLRDDLHLLVTASSPGGARDGRPR